MPTKKLNFQNCFNKIKLNDFGDFKLEYQSKWPFYEFNFENENSLWHLIQDKIDQTCDDFEFTPEDIDDFLDKNPDMELEIDFFINEVSDIFFFKFKNEIFCYVSNTTEMAIRNEPKILCRFFFDLEKFLKD